LSHFALRTSAYGIQPILNPRDMAAA
jgi:hypothetical protein